MKELGINLVHVISYVLIFIILYLFTKKFLHKTLENLEERKKIIAEGIQNSQKAQEILEKKSKEAQSKYEEILVKAFQDSEKIIQEAQQKASEIIKHANQRKEEILQEGLLYVENAKKTGYEQGLSEAREIISIAIQKTFSEIDLTADQHEKILRTAIERLEKLKNI